MKKILGVLCSGLLFCGYCFAASMITNGSYSIEGNNVVLYWTDLSEGGIGNVDVNVRDSDSQPRRFIGSVDSREQSFSYEKQGDGSQEIWLTPNDGSEGLRIHINSTNGHIGNTSTYTENTDSYTSEHGSAGAVEYKQNESSEDFETITRTVITAVPKTGPSGNLIGIILATFSIFGGYIYIKKRADI